MQGLLRLLMTVPLAMALGPRGQTPNSAGRREGVPIAFHRPPSFGASDASEGAVQGTWTNVYGAATVEPAGGGPTQFSVGRGRGEDFEKVFGLRLLPGAASAGDGDGNWGGSVAITCGTDKGIKGSLTLQVEASMFDVKAPNGCEH